jgi:hypothetical protein
MINCLYYSNGGNPEKMLELNIVYLNLRIMDLFDRKIGPLLVANKKINDGQLKSLIDRSEKEKRSLREIVIADNLASEQEIAKMYSLQTGVPYTEFNPKDIPSEILKIIPQHIAKQYRAYFIRQGKRQRYVSGGHGGSG